jgi:hypothetical protein
VPDACSDAARQQWKRYKSEGEEEIAVKARIIEQSAKVYSEADSRSPVMEELAVGKEIELGGVKKNNGLSFVTVTLPSGQKGYLSGDTKIYHIKGAHLVQKSVNVFAEPFTQSRVVTQYGKNAKLYLTGVVKQGGSDWVKVRDDVGNEGFIEGNTKIKVIPEAVTVTRELGGKNMLHGALWCIGGITVTFVTYSSAVSSGGGTYVVTWGAILFGGLQFLKGMYQSITARD